MTVEWAEGVNSRFFAYNDRPTENAKINSMLSGKKIGYRLNTRDTASIKCKIKLTVKEELPLFWSWYNDELGQLAGTFTCEALGSKVYQFTSTPEPEDTDQQFRVLSLEIEEV